VRTFDLDRRENLPVDDRYGDFDPLDERFDQDFGGELEFVVERLFPLRLGVDLGDADGRTFHRGLEDDREGHFLGQFPVFGGDDSPFRGGDAEAVHQPFAGDLVHQEQACRAARADEAQVIFFKYLLDSAVFAVAAVQHGVDHVGLAHFRVEAAFGDVGFDDRESGVPQRGGYGASAPERDFALARRTAVEDVDFGRAGRTEHLRLRFRIEEADFGAQEKSVPLGHRATHGGEEFDVFRLAGIAGVDDVVGVFFRHFDAADPAVFEAALVDQLPGGLGGGNIAEGTSGASSGGLAAAALADFGFDRGEFLLFFPGGERQQGAGEEDVFRDGTAPITPLDFVPFGAIGRTVEPVAAHFGDELADGRAGGPGVHAERAAERPRDSGQRSESAESGIRGEAGEFGQAAECSGAEAVAVAFGSAESVPAQPEAEFRAGGIHSGEVGAAAEEEDRNPFAGGQFEQCGKLVRAGEFGEEREFRPDAERGEFGVGHIGPDAEIRQLLAEQGDLCFHGSHFRYTSSGLKTGWAISTRPSSSTRR